MTIPVRLHEYGEDGALTVHAPDCGWVTIHGQGDRPGLPFAGDPSEDKYTFLCTCEERHSVRVFAYLEGCRDGGENGRILHESLRHFSRYGSQGLSAESIKGLLDGYDARAVEQRAVEDSVLDLVR